jgi:hypothetical protein
MQICTLIEKREGSLLTLIGLPQVYSKEGARFHKDSFSNVISKKTERPKKISTAEYISQLNNK